MPGFDDRTVSLDATEQMADLGAVLASKTRLAVLGVLVRTSVPLNIHELARRVGVDASPVRTHLELLLKAGLIREVASASGRERKFETSLTGIRVTLENVNRPPLPAGVTAPPKDVQRVEKKIAALAKDIARIEEKARRYHAEIQAAYAKAANKVVPPVATKTRGG